MELEELNSGKNGVEKALAGKKAKQEDQITDIVGVFGPYQAVLFTICGLAIVIHNWQMLANKFYTYKTDFWCARPENLKHLNIENWLNLSSPLINGTTDEFNKCAMFDVDYTKINNRPEENVATKPCTSFEYNSEPFEVGTHCSKMKMNGKKLSRFQFHFPRLL